ncbi:alpha/beta fold hydrolase [Micromonospora tulbaghiae]|uniref:Alpha/beta hydrolase n=1 Tax=Micromonospora tulbaghiae TaxID=479978 RepID=A0AAW4JLF3_9ACTN|nr:MULTISPECIES: alpha/beta hydrolase [Micromonospora]KAB1902864.1 alpha/beta hydrolase [Micromonospora sp. AMSO1212t]MBO4143241.1 alpha/beta hydrolase [Micromonospora tulbaghiae]MDX5458832.1 alpha/beta hydrolase [Micromonospora tulbaghiae]SCF03240.1 Pimeloyl-ACP methyl ester carboxylesterase [Micromonospora tulbaghiae]
MRGFRWPPPPDGGPRTWGPGPGAPRTGRPALPEPETELVATPHGASLERLVTGTGDPVTVFAHGLGSGIATTRPFGSGVAGRRIFFQFRGHGRSDSPPGRWSYLDLARDLRAVADLGGATRAFGASLGAGALCRLLVESPERFEKLVFFLPAVLDTPRGEVARARLTGLLDAVAEGDASALADAVSLELPPSVRNTPAGWAYLRQRLDQLLRDGLAPGLADLPAQAPLDDAGSLAAVTAPALVIAAAEDDLHPVGVAERLAAALPNATLHVYDRPGVLWTERADLRERVSEFLNG